MSRFQGLCTICDIYIYIYIERERERDYYIYISSTPPSTLFAYIVKYYVKFLVSRDG
jgi:hypothetical protein